MKTSILVLSFFMMISCLTRRTPESPQTASAPTPNFNELASEIKQAFGEYQTEATQQNEQIASEMQTAIHNVEQASIQDISQALANMDTTQIQSDVQTAMATQNSGSNTNANKTLSTVSQILSYGGGGLLIVLATTNFFVTRSLYKVQDQVSKQEQVVADARYDVDNFESHKKNVKFIEHLRTKIDAKGSGEIELKRAAERFLKYNEFLLDMYKVTRYLKPPFVIDDIFTHPSNIRNIDKKILDDYTLFYESYVSKEHSSRDIIPNYIKEKYISYAKKYTEDTQAKQFLQNPENQKDRISNMIDMLNPPPATDIHGNVIEVETNEDITRRNKIRNSNIASLFGILAGATLITLQATNQLGLADTSALGHLKQKLAEIELKIQKLKQT